MILTLATSQNWLKKSLSGQFSQICLCEISHLYNTVFVLGNCHKIPFRCLLVCHILRRKAWKLPYLKTDVHCGFWPVAKFGSFILWMVVIVARSQNWEKKKTLVFVAPANTRVIYKVTLFWAYFHPLSPLSVLFAK
jgi:hypothetical protein